MPKNITELSDAEKLCLAGFTVTKDVETAYRLSRRNYNPQEPDAKNHRRLALRWLREPGCKAYLDYLSNVTPTHDADEPDAESKTYREKEAVIAEMEKLIPTLTGTDRLQALMRLADLQNMKKEEVVVEEDRIHYYLPLGSHLNYCTNCIHKDRMEKLNPDLKFTNNNEED